MAPCTTPTTGTDLVTSQRQGPPCPVSTRLPLLLLGRAAASPHGSRSASSASPRAPSGRRASQQTAPVEGDVALSPALTKSAPADVGLRPRRQDRQGRRPGDRLGRPLGLDRRPRHDPVQGGPERRRSRPDLQHRACCWPTRRSSPAGPPCSSRSSCSSRRAPTAARLVYNGTRTRSSSTSMTRMRASTGTAPTARRRRQGLLHRRRSEHRRHVRRHVPARGRRRRPAGRLPEVHRHGRPRVLTVFRRGGLAPAPSPSPSDPSRCRPPPS